MIYKVETIKDGTEKYFFIRNLETMSIEELPSKYLMHKIKCKRSPNTVKRTAFSICYYMKYMAEKEMELTEVYQLDYEKQTEHFVEFLYWLKAGNHTEQTAGEKKCPNEGTCNAYLKDVFRFYLFIEAEYEQYGSLKTLSYNQIIAVNQVGVKKVLRNHSFKAYLKEEEHRGRTAKENQIITILQACTNRRDQLLLLMLAETGYRIGELLGVKYVKDIDYRNHMIRVCFREDNENEARAKNAEYRSAKISNDTFEFLMDYLAKYRKILQHQDYLFVNIMGENIGKPLRVDSVYDMLARMEKKTGVKITPHMLRHYFANMRKQAGWELEMISQALGHKHLDTTIKYLDWLDDELIEATGTRKDNGKFDLTLLPTQELKEEFRGYIMYRCKNGTFRALIQDRTAYNHIAKFLNSRINRRIKSLGDRNPEKWISLLKGWMLEQGITIVKEKKSVYGTVSYGEAVTILYFRNVLKFLGPEDLRDEIEKDVWELKNLDIKIRSNPIYNVKTLDFRKIYQPDIREECKKAVYMNLQYEAIGTVQGELTIMRIFSEYLQKEYSKIKSCSEIDREVLEEFLIHLSTKDTSHSANSSYVISLRRQLETIGKIYSYERLEHLFINTDIPPEVNAEFRVYSDDEMKRLNAEITQMDVQIARCLLIHQMLGTRISDTLTLRPDCLTRENGQDMIEIYQVKTKRYKKPISKELAKLLQSSIEYTQEKFGDTEYIFVNEKEPDRPMQYMAIKTKVMSMIQEKQLKDDHGELFGFGTHMFRHYYGVKLTEMHLDDWTIARLLGHKRLNNVQHYRKMSNQRMADETREVRQMMSDIIYMSLAGWGEEYEQIRQDD